MQAQIDRGQMKLDARASMREHRPSVYLVTLVFLVIVDVLGTLAMRLIYPNLDMQVLMTSAGDQEVLVRMIEKQNSSVAWLLAIAILVMFYVLSIGFTSFCLKVARGTEAGFIELFDGFENFLGLLWLNVLIGIFVALWSLLLVVPGIIATYRYSMAVYIMLDDPDKSAMQCIRESKEMTNGHIMELFVLKLSFIGWDLLSIISVVFIFAEPYIGITFANYYRALSGRWDPQPHVDYSI